VLHMQPVVSASCMWLKTVLYLGRLLLLFGILLSPMILPYELVAAWANIQYSIVHLVQRYPPILSSSVNGINRVLQYEQKYFSASDLEFLISITTELLSLSLSFIHYSLLLL
jgi:hypothetical protein